jgi:hypothetical protein
MEAWAMADTPLAKWLFFPEDFVMTTPPQGATLRKAGVCLALLGAFVLLVVAILTAKGIFASAEKPCVVPATPPNEALFIPSPLGVNESACLVIKPAALFKTEFEKRNTLVRTKESALTTANAVTGPERDTRVTAATTDLADAKSAVAAPIQASEFALFIDNRKTSVRILQGYKPEEGVVAVRIPLRAPVDAKTDEAKTWREILAGAGLTGSRTVSVALVPADQAIPSPSALSGKGTLEVFAPGSVWLGAAALLAMAAGILMAAWYTGMFRDGPLNTATGALPPFSLGRLQMAWWFFLVFGGFLFIWLVTGQFTNVMNSQAVTLIGISLTSGLAARVIDATSPTPHGQSRTLLADILFDGSTVSMHRLQMTVWTIVLGAAFVWSVVYTYAFPEFDTSLLVLAGIVNGTYIGFKLPEAIRPAPGGAQPAPVPPQPRQ